MANPPTKRKRNSAFDDFPVEDAATQAPQQTTQTASKIRPAQADGQPLASQQTPIVERIERLKPSQMMPDRFQPRRLLPSGLRELFYQGGLDCYQTAERWLALSRQDNAHRPRSTACWRWANPLTNTARSNQSPARGSRQMTGATFS